MRKPKKAKRVKLEALPKIRRRLRKLWTLAVRAKFRNRCAITGIEHGAVGSNGKPAILNCHHLETYRMCPALRYDYVNGILLSPSAHKYGRNSAHQGCIWFAEWLRTKRPEQYAYVLKHRDDVVDLNSREYLYAIETRLNSIIDLLDPRHTL